MPLSEHPNPIIIIPSSTQSVKLKKFSLAKYALTVYNKDNLIIILIMLPVNTPAEVLDISPEALEVANQYLQCQDIKEVSEALDLAPQLVTQILSKREVKAYIDNVFMNVGFNNRFRMRDAMDAVIKQKFQELQESGMGSSKDIAELLALSHKMSMDELDKQIKLETLRQSNIKNQVNVQINDDGSKYSHLIQTLLGNVQQGT